MEYRKIMREKTDVGAVERFLSLIWHKLNLSKHIDDLYVYEQHILCFSNASPYVSRLDKQMFLCYNHTHHLKGEMLMRMRLNSTIRLLAAFLCMLLIVPAVPVNISAKTIGEIQDEQAALQQETSELESQLASLQDDEAKAQEYSETLSEQITHLQSKIDTTRKNINDLNDNITKLQKKLDESQLEYDTTMEQLKDRIKVLYQAGDVSTIEILLKSTSLYDFSMRTEMLKSMTSHDRQLMDKITDFMVKTKEDREALKKQKEEVAELQKSLESDQEDLIAAQAKNDAIIAGLQAQQADKKQQIAANEEEDEALNAELERLMAEKKKADEEAAKNAGGSGGSSDGNTVYVPPSTGGGGGLDAQWPLPGYSTNDITQYFGNNGHGGMDIGVPYGSPIVASADGEVLSASSHWSWGNNVLVYHNGTYSTRYAHMSSMAVSEGEHVSRGQVIGYVGSTGNSTGPHLHFEVYCNGTRVDPYPYLTSYS